MVSVLEVSQLFIAIIAPILLLLLWMVLEDLAIDVFAKYPDSRYGMGTD